MDKVRLSLIFSSAAKYGLQLLSLISSIVVARLLTPEEIGTFAIASSLVMVISEFRLLGAGVYLVREAELTDEKIKRALGLSSLICWGLGISIIASAPYLGEFYGDESITYIFIILSFSFFVGPYISVIAALLSREFNYQRIFMVRICTALVAFATTICFILAGASYFSMAISQLAAAIVQFSLYMWFRPKKMPLMPSLRNIGEIAKFGVFNSLASVLNRTQLTMPDVIIGKIGTVRDVGIFSRGLGFIDYLSSSITMGVSPVALPYLSEINKEKRSLSDAYMKAALYITGLTWPVLAVAHTMALPAIRFFFGDQWDEAAPLAATLAIWAAIRSTNSFFPQAMLATGKEKLLFYKELVVFGILAMSIYTAYPMGLDAVALCFFLVGLVEMLIVKIILFASLRINTFVFLKMLWKSAAVAVICFTVSYYLRGYLDNNDFQYSVMILVCALLLAPTWFASLFLVKHPLSIEIATIIKSRFRR